VYNDLVLVKPGSMGNALARVLGGARKREGLGSVEGDRGADFPMDLRVGALESGLLCVCGLLGGRLGPYAQNPSDTELHNR